MTELSTITVNDDLKARLCDPDASPSLAWGWRRAPFSAPATEPCREEAIEAALRRVRVDQHVGPGAQPAGTVHRLAEPRHLEAAFAPVLDSEKVVVYCGQGIAASADALALVLVGHDDVALYDGSLDEWTGDDDAPLEALAA